MLIRKLGYSLGYTYFHKTLYCFRSLWAAHPLNLPWSLAQLIFLMHARLIRTFSAKSVWDSLGLNDYLARRAKAQKQVNLRECKQVNIKLGDYVLKQNGISTLEELQTYVRRAAARENLSERPLLLNVRLMYPLDSFRSIMSSIPDSIDDLDLRAIYLEHRRRHLRNPKYPPQGLRTLVHIRQGESAAVRTPWKTWVYWSRGGGRGLRWLECREENEFRQLTVSDFHHFIQGISSRFTDNAFAVQIFSDGFERAFRQIHGLNDGESGLKLTRKRLDSLLAYRRRYAREFKILERMKNSRLTVGEVPQGKLIRLIDAVSTADLLIAAFPKQMGVFQIRRHFALPASVPTILLYKPIAEKQMRDFLENNPSDKIIPVDISAPDFDRTATRLTELLPALAPLFLRKTRGEKAAV